MLISIEQRDMTKVFSCLCLPAFQRMCWGWANSLPSTSSRASERGPAVLPEELDLSCGPHCCGLSRRREDFQCLGGPSVGLVVGRTVPPFALPPLPILSQEALFCSTPVWLRIYQDTWHLWVTHGLWPGQWPWGQMVETARSESLPLLPPPTCLL